MMEIEKLKGKVFAMSRNSLGKRGLIAGLFALFAATLSAQNLNQIELSSDWYMQDATVIERQAKKEGWYRQGSDKLPEEGRTVSKKDFNVENWYKATVPGTVLTTLVNNKVYPEPLYDENNRPEKIPEDLCKKDWWYRTTVKVPENFKDKRIWLKFNGINYSAGIWVNGKYVGPVQGAFIRGVFDITRNYDVKPGQETTIAVRISPQPTTGVPSEHIMGTTGGPCGGVGRLDGATFGCSVGWDWQSGIRDRNSGIWQKVFLSATGSAIIKDPYVTTTLPNLPKLDLANVSIDVPVQNVTTFPVKGVLKGSFGNVKFEKEVEIKPYHTETVKFTPAEFPQLAVKNPKLWWPNGLGEPNLHELKLSFEINNEVSDEKKLNFGIREFKYFETDTPNIEDGKPTFKLSVNGVRVFMKGGNWGIEEALKRIDYNRLEKQVKFHRDLNFNMIRNWGGQCQSDELFELCDKYGMLFWSEFWQFNNSNPFWMGNYMSNVVDTVLRYRNHASLVIWCARNEARPPKYLDDALRYELVKLDPNRHYQPNSGGMYGYNSGGPYDWVPPVRYSRYLEVTNHNRNETFKTEIGSFSVPTIESIQGMFPKSEWDGITDSWAEHNFCSGGGRKYPEFMEKRYGAPKNLADFVQKAQLMNYETHKAMYEGRFARMFEPAEGVLYWMSIPSQPSFIWQLIQYDLETNASFFGVKKACEHQHIQYTETEGGQIQVINHLPKDLSGAKGSIAFYNLDGSFVAKKDFTVTAKGESRTIVGKIEWPANLTDIHFLKLELKNAKGKLISDNFYWRHIKGSPEKAEVLKDDYKMLDLGSFKDLQNMPKVTIKADAKLTSNKGEQIIDLQLKNPSENVALMIHLQVQGKSSKKRILPVSYSDNYISLVPGEKKVVRMSFAKDSMKKGDSPVIMVDGWNVEVKDSDLVKNNKNATASNWENKGFDFKARPLEVRKVARINCGGYNRGEKGRIFEKDPGFLKGAVGFQTQDVIFEGAKLYKVASDGTWEKPEQCVDASKYVGPNDMYRTVRWGNSEYTSLLAGKKQKHTVILHFAEASGDKTPGRAAFDVKANGKVILKDFDVSRAAGGMNKVVVVEIKNVESDENGYIKLEFTGGAKRKDGESRDPRINGYEIIPQK